MPDEPDNRTKITEIIEVADECLSAWERGFIEKLSEMTDVGHLTDKQTAKLAQIYQKVCDSPY